MIQLGEEVKDRVTGFKGIAVARHEFLNGCVRFSIQPVMGKEKKLEDEKWFDEGQLEVIGKGVKIEKKPTGGPVGSRPPAMKKPE